MALLGCDEGGDNAPDDSETETVTGDETDGETDTEAFSCESAPAVTYETFGQGFLSSYCNGCHGAAAADRRGAPPMVVFDDAAQATQWAPRIRSRVFVDDQAPPMPPAGGIPPDDLARAEIWLDCYPGS